MSNAFEYDPDTLASLEAVISTERLHRYRQAADGDVRRALELYVWNAEASAAPYYPLQSLEIALRNALHRELSRAFSHPWHDEPRFRAVDPEIGASIDKAKEAIAKRRPLRSVTTPRVVAELPMGFWIHLLGPGENASYQKEFWGPALSKAFPKGLKRSRVEGELRPLLSLRNRIAHHEAILEKDLHRHYCRILKVAEWLSPDLTRWIEHHSAWTEVLSRRPAALP